VTNQWLINDAIVMGFNSKNDVSDSKYENRDRQNDTEKVIENEILFLIFRNFLQEISKYQNTEFEMPKFRFPALNAFRLEGGPITDNDGRQMGVIDVFLFAQITFLQMKMEKNYTNILFSKFSSL
jgi:hypothetical protein